MYQITLENNNKISLYEDTILKFNLLISKKIDLKDRELFDFDMRCAAYYSGLKLLKNRTRSKKEVSDKLFELDFSKELVEFAIEKLEKQGYINDLFYAKSFVNNKIITTTNGPYKIKKDLLNKGVKQDLIDEALSDYTSDIEKEKIRKMINRIIKANRTRGNILLKKKIFMDLSVQGFNKNLINEEINNTDFPSDCDISKKEYDKLYSKLSKKYSGNELELKIKQKMYQKGLINFEN